MKTIFYLLSINIMLINLSLKAQTWVNLGENGAIANGTESKIAVNNSNTYLIYADATNEYRATLKMYNGK